MFRLTFTDTDDRFNLFFCCLMNVFWFKIHFADTQWTLFTIHFKPVLALAAALSFVLWTVKLGRFIN